MAKYTERIRRIASYVDAGERVADIGSDHGYLALWLAREGISPQVIVTDIAEGPLGIARANAEAEADRCPECARTDCRLGDGLAPLAPGEVDVVVIAGMGGETIRDIMAADPAKTASFAKYILQPRTKAELLREWLAERYAIATEDTVNERGRACPIIVVRTDNVKGTSDRVKNASTVIARSEATRQSIQMSRMDCFASLAMTGTVSVGAYTLTHVRSRQENER
jgi:tRNA (adenine22-N1)-methyltransferase